MTALDPSKDINHLDFAPELKCEMFHIPDGEETTVGIKCERPAAWIGTHHSCKDRYREAGNRNIGEVAMFCEFYLQRVKNAEYEQECRGCGAHFTSLLDRVWEFVPIKSSLKDPNEGTP